MLRPNLHDEIALLDRVARGLHLLEHVPHRLFAVGVLARLHRFLEHRRMRVLRRRDEDGVDVLHRQQLVGMLHGLRRATVVLRRPRGGALAIVLPEIAHRHGLDVVLVFELRRHRVKSAAAVADADVPERDAVVRAQDAVVRQGGRGNRGARDHPGSLNERSAIDLLVVRVLHVRLSIRQKVSQIWCRVRASARASRRSGGIARGVGSRGAKRSKHDSDTEPELPLVDPFAPEILHAGDRHEVFAVADVVVRIGEMRRVGEIVRLEVWRQALRRLKGL